MANDPRKINIALWDLPNGETCKVTVRYPTVAGLTRAYTLHVQPVTFEPGDGYTVERYSPHRGYRMTLEAAPRYSRKRLETLAESPDTFTAARNLFDRCAADVGGA